MDNQFHPDYDFFLTLVRSLNIALPEKASIEYLMALQHPDVSGKVRIPIGRIVPFSRAMMDSLFYANLNTVAVHDAMV